MMNSFPANELPLEDLLESAAIRRIIAILNLESDFTVGHIDIVNGEVVDAAFGGLEREEAVYAALRSTTLRIRRGRAPKLPATRRITLSTERLLAQSAQRRT
jgi:hypothetical protein